MIKIILLIWTLISNDGIHNQIIVEQFDSIEACQERGDDFSKASEAMKEAKQIVTYAGECYTVQGSNNGSV